jgi:hypothetical protein
MAGVVIELTFTDGNISAVVDDKPIAIDEQAKALLSKLGFCCNFLDGHRSPYALTALQ